MSDPSRARAWRRLLIEPARPAAIRALPAAPWLAVGTVCIGAFMGQLDASIVTLAFESLHRAFGAPLSSVQWVGQAYLLTLVGLLTAVGRYADMVGRKLLYTYGFGIFIVGSALCGLAPSLPALIGFRVIQGAGAAFLQANSVAIIVGAMPRARLGRAIGVQGAAQALGLALGPAVGGLLIDAGGWRLIFFVNVPVGILAIALALFLLPRSRHLAARVRFDWAGLALFLPAVVALLLVVSYGDLLGWVSPAALALFAVAVLIGAAFLLRESRAPAPMLDLRLFARAAFSAGIGSGLLSYLVLFGTLTAAPLYLENALGQAPGVAGVELLLLPLGLGVVAPIAGRLSDQLGSRPLAVGGMLLVAAALAAAVFLHQYLPLLLVLLLVAGIGLGSFTPPNNASIMSAAPPHQSGMASGVLNMTRGLGTSLGLVVASVVYTVGAASGHGPAGAAAGFVDAIAVLAALSLLAAVVAGARPGKRPGAG